MRHFRKLDYKTEEQSSHFDTSSGHDTVQVKMPVLEKDALTGMSRGEYKWPSGYVEKVLIYVDVVDRSPLGIKHIPYFNTSYRGKEIRVDLEKGDLIHIF